MKAYLILTGSIFGLLALLHLVRLVTDGGHAFVANPWFGWGNLAAVVLSGGIAFWAGWLFAHQGPGDRGSKV